jgi:hypothetical protein
MPWSFCKVRSFGSDCDAKKLHFMFPLSAPGVDEYQRECGLFLVPGGIQGTNIGLTLMSPATSD